MLITSLQNPRVKEAAKLRDRRDRTRQGRFLIDGSRELHRALAAGVELLELFLCPERCTTDSARDVLEQLGRPSETASPERTGMRRPPAVWTVSPQVFDKLAFGERAEGVLGVARLPQRTLDDLRLPKIPLVLVLEQIEKPGNVGAVLRTADGVGASAVIVTGGTDLYNPNVIRASLGTVFTVPVCAATSEAARAWLTQHKMKIFSARVDAPAEYTASDFRGPTALVLGAESSGLSDQWTGPPIAPIRLPMHGQADSLNVSVTAAVLCYEVLRQRQIEMTAGG